MDERRRGMRLEVTVAIGWVTPRERCVWLPGSMAVRLSHEEIRDFPPRHRGRFGFTSIG